MNRALYDQYNARFMKLDAVGRSFIVSDLFRQVAANHHSALVGPRGSGKTTFLKMLTLPALATWQHKLKAQIVGEMEYFAVYAPSDYAWFPDFRVASRERYNSGLDQLLAGSIFRHHLLKAMLDATQQQFDGRLLQDKLLAKFHLNASESTEIEFARILNETWQLAPKFSGLFGLRIACSLRIKALQRLLTESASRQLDEPAVQKDNPYIADYFYDDIVSFMDTRNHFFTNALKCCVCFDELEIAPRQIKTTIVKSARSADQRLYIKISASPYDEDLEEIYDPRMPMGEHDYTPIVLSYARTQDSRTFSSQLFKAMAAGYELKVTPEELLGSSRMEMQEAGSIGIYDRPAQLRSKQRKRRSRYSLGGANQKSFAELYEKDETFKRYLRSRDIWDVEHFQDLPEGIKAQDIRKIIGPVIVRNEYFRPTAERDRRTVERRLRTLKRIPDIYTGAESILAMCEGNPRWIIGTLKPLFDEYQKLGKSGPVARHLQAERLTKTIVTFLSLLAAIPATDNDSSEALSIVDLIERIGDFFEGQILGRKFNPDPVTTVVVDKRLPADHQIAFGRAINQGAFVLVPDRLKDFQLGKIEKYRFRMTYLFAPLYHFPLVLGRANQLSTILENKDKSASIEPPSVPYQGLLFSLFQATEGEDM